MVQNIDQLNAAISITQQLYKFSLGLCKVATNLGSEAMDVVDQQASATAFEVDNQASDTSDLPPLQTSLSTRSYKSYLAKREQAPSGVSRDDALRASTANAAPLFAPVFKLPHNAKKSGWDFPAAESDLPILRVHERTSLASSPEEVNTEKSSPRRVDELRTTRCSSGSSKSSSSETTLFVKTRSTGSDCGRSSGSFDFTPGSPGIAGQG